MKKKLIALVCALALAVGLVGCSLSTPDSVGTIGDVDIPSGLYLLAQFDAYQTAADLASDEQDASKVSSFLKATITVDDATGETAVVSDYVAQKTLENLESYAAIETRFDALGGVLTPDEETQADSYASQLMEQNGDLYKANGIGLDTLKRFERILIKSNDLLEMCYGTDGETPVSDAELTSHLEDDMVYIRYTVIPLYNTSTFAFADDDQSTQMLELAQTMYDTTGGKLNIALGSVLNIWHNYREAAESHQNEADNTLPTQEELEAAAQHCDINDLVIDEKAKTVYLSDPEMSLDVGSVGKGYAVEMVCRAAEARGLTSALVSVGGNLRAIGTKPDGSQWTGGVEDPWNASEVYTNTNSIFGSPINMSDLALVTSGDYQRYFVVDGKRYHHIIDPDTLWPAAYYNGVTVLCPDSGMADCLTTALFCMPLEEGQKLVESLDGVEAMWCTPDKQATTSSGWDSHLKK